MPTSARPLDSARLAPFWSGKTWHVDRRLAGRRCTSCSARSASSSLGRALLDARPCGRTGRRALLIVGPPLGLDVERRAGAEVGDEVDRLLALLGVGERGHAEVVLAGREARDDRCRTSAFDDVRLQAHDRADAPWPGRRPCRSTVLPSASMNSFGAYVASAATVSVPFDLIAAGTFAATVASFVAVIPPLAPLDPAWAALLELLDPHAASSSGRSAAATPMARARRRPDGPAADPGVCHDAGTRAERRIGLLQSHRTRASCPTAAPRSYPGPDHDRTGTTRPHAGRRRARAVPRPAHPGTLRRRACGRRARAGSPRAAPRSRRRTAAVRRGR